MLAAKLIQLYGDRDLLVEMTVAGASVQWGAALGATVVPQQIGGYCEDQAIEFCAAIYSGFAPDAGSLPSTDIVPVVEDLFCIDNDAPILEVSKLFSGVDLSRIRNVVKGMIAMNQDPEHLADAVRSFNGRVARYERNATRLSKMSIAGGVGAIAASYGVSNSPAVSCTLWGLALLFSDTRPSGVLGRMLDVIRGLNAFTSPNVVLVSRISRSVQSL